VPDGSATARAIDYSLKRWKALMRFIDDGELPIDDNWIENQIPRVRHQTPFLSDFSVETSMKSTRWPFAENSV